MVGACTTEPASGAPEPLPATEPETVQAPLSQDNTDDFIVSEELYQQTFDDIESLIDRISAIVVRQDYNAWLTYLTDDYITYYSNPDVLEKMSLDLQKSTGYRIKLRSLRDYFRYVVVNSRIDVELDKIEFIDENRITAEALINDKPYILYYLEKIEGVWKIGKW